MNIIYNNILFKNIQNNVSQQKLNKPYFITHNMIYTLITTKKFPNKILARIFWAKFVGQDFCDLGVTKFGQYKNLGKFFNCGFFLIEIAIVVKKLFLFSCFQVSTFVSKNCQLFFVKFKLSAVCCSETLFNYSQNRCTSCIINSFHAKRKTLKYRSFFIDK